MKKLLLSVCLFCTFLLQAQTDYIEAVVNNGSTSQLGRAPQGASRYNRSVWIITAAEMSAAGFTANTAITGIGFNYLVGQNIPTTGDFVVYLQNTADVTNTKSLTWSTAITGMTTVHDAPVTIPATAGVFDVAFSGGSSFTYTGGGLYVAFDYANESGPLATAPNTALCTNTVTGGLKGAISDTGAPATVAASAFRPETRLARAVSCLRPTGVYADAITTNTATLHWTAPSTAPTGGYDYYIGTTLTTPATSVTPTGSTAAGVTTTSITTGLTPGAEYYVWVRSKCSGTDKSAWSPYGIFQTRFTPATPPYAEGFEDDIYGWTLLNAGAGGDWTVLTDADVTAIPDAAEGIAYAAYVFSETDPGNAWLFSRPISLTAGLQYTFTFKYRVASATFPEALTVKIGNDNTVAAQTTTLFTNNNISAVVWTQATATFTPATTGVYNVGFNCTSAADRWILAVDDFNVSAGVAGVDEAFASKLSVYPNPATNVINVSNADALVNGVSFTDLNGRTVKTVKFEGVSEAQINIADLSAGMYLMNIASDKGSVTKKIVKQ